MVTTAVTAAEPQFRGLVAGITSCCRQLGATLIMAILSMIIAYAHHDDTSTLYEMRHSYMVALTVSVFVTMIIAITCYSISGKLPVKTREEI